jgi:hypothetical protein
LQHNADDAISANPRSAPPGLCGRSGLATAGTVIKSLDVIGLFLYSIRSDRLREWPTAE